MRKFDRIDDRCWWVHWALERKLYDCAIHELVDLHDECKLITLRERAIELIKAIMELERESAS